MGYCSVDAVKAVKAIRRLTTPDGSWTDDDIRTLIESVSAGSIDPRISKWTAVPVSPAPETLLRICALKTAYEMLAQEYAGKEGDFEFLNREAEWLLGKIERREILIDSGICARPGMPAISIDDPNRYMPSIGD